MTQQNDSIDLFPIPKMTFDHNKSLNLLPAKWIWYPSERCLPNTFVLFRKELDLKHKPVSAKGWILADSRYILSLNGERVQFGPAPHDPRWPEVDPVDLTSFLEKGKNVVGSTVLFYGHGDGTWPVGKPGFIFYLEIEYKNGNKQIVVSDSSWRANLAKSWKAGHYKRWYLRSLQEEFDARQYPYGWNTPNFISDNDWLPALELNCPADKPAICSTFTEYMMDIQADASKTELRPRVTPLMNEYFVPIKNLSESLWLEWRRPPNEYFDFLTPDSFNPVREPSAVSEGDGCWLVKIDGTLTPALIFEFEEQIVGWPQFTIEAPAGTVVELLVQEAHEVGGPPLLNSHFHSWTRFICKEGVNNFEPFDYESCRWLQLHIHNAEGIINIKNVGMRRRVFAWQHKPEIQCSEPDLQKLFDASVNTLNNCAQDILVDGMARERQQYSGDCGHQLHAIFYTFGETRSPARYIKTYSQGMTLDGYFMNCWPAYDRLARLMERQLQLSGWGPILDHGIGFNFDCYYYYLHTGDLETLKEPFPRLLKFFEYLKSIQQKNGLLPVEDLGIPSVWIDHDAYTKQKHKQCAFNLYAAAMLEHALSPICKAFGEKNWEVRTKNFGKELLNSCMEHFWSKRHGIFVNNLPWFSEEKKLSLCDRSLATAVLFDQCQNRNTSASLKALAECPPEMGISYPANAGWRLWALAKLGRTDIILKEFREKWSKMDSVLLNNTLQEYWTVKPDSDSQWSHCPVAPLYVLYMSLAGIKPLDPGFSRCEIRPQMDDLEKLDIIIHTVKGPIAFKSEGLKGEREITILLPDTCAGELVIKREETVNLKLINYIDESSNSRYVLPPGKETKIKLKHT